MLKYCAVFSLWAGVGLAADYTTYQAARLVIGQTNFTSQNSGTSSTTMGAMSGIAFAANTLIVADSNRLGYTPVNDVTARDLQRKDGQWTRGKGFDTFCPVGPYIVSRDEADLSHSRVRTFVDGEMKQDAAISEMIFSVNDIIEYVSAFMTLEPGDLIATGTPSGVGPLQPGSRVRVEIEGVGALENTVVAEDRA